MARSPLTLAAAVTSALPRTGVVNVSSLSEGTSGRYDSAVATLDDGTRAVVRVPVGPEADADLRAESRALRALSAGVRGVLPFTAPEVLGEADVDRVRALVQTLLPGYRVDAAHIPAGRGVATSIGDALARIHDLPVSVVRDAGLSVRTAAQVRDELERVLDRAEATGRLPFGLLRRWSTALGSEDLWRFETTVILGGVDPASFVLQDVDDTPTVTGLLTWGGLSAGDPAVDLRWTASAAAARDDVLDAYAARAHRAPDPLIADRARLHAEFEFARWLVHGVETGSEQIVTDAVALLESLEASVRDEPPVSATHVTAEDALAFGGRVPEGATDGEGTSMQTDAYRGSLLDLDDETPATDMHTVPIELSDFTTRSLSGPPVTPTAAGEAGDVDELDEAARNALRRWTGTS